MALIVIGGQSHNIGKTTVACAIISAMAACRWTAIKITPVETGDCPLNGPGCGCLPEEHPYCLLTEAKPGPGTDTARFLAAGASGAIWARVKRSGYAELAPGFSYLARPPGNVLLESNSIVEYLRPDFYLMVLNSGVPDWKSSARRLIGQAHAALVVAAQWSPTAELPPLCAIPGQVAVFNAGDPSQIPPDLMSLIGCRVKTTMNPG